MEQSVSGPRPVTPGTLGGSSPSPTPQHGPELPERRSQLSVRGGPDPRAPSLGLAESVIYRVSPEAFRTAMRERNVSVSDATFDALGIRELLEPEGWHPRGRGTRLTRHRGSSRSRSKTAATRTGSRRFRVSTSGTTSPRPTPATFTSPSSPHPTCCHTSPTRPTVRSGSAVRRSTVRRCRPRSSGRRRR